MRRSARWTCVIIGMAGVTGCAQHGAAVPRAAVPRAAGVAPGLGVHDSVAVGYGMMPRRNATGAVGTVDGATGQRDGVLRVEEMLRRLPGVVVTPTVGGRYSVRVRGGGVKLAAGSLAPTEPLVVIDGTPLPIGPGALDNLSPADVDRIDVLKDAEAAIYGSRGANGVILVRTKRWKP